MRTGERGGFNGSPSTVEEKCWQLTSTFSRQHRIGEFESGVVKTETSDIGEGRSGGSRLQATKEG